MVVGLLWWVLMVGVVRMDLKLVVVMVVLRNFILIVWCFVDGVGGGGD